MAGKAAEKSYRQFPGVVCERLRWLVEVQNKSENERKEMFAARDHARQEMHKLNDGEKVKRERLEADYGRCVMEIERLKATITWAGGEIKMAVRNPDKLELFQDLENKVPDFTEEDEEEEEEDSPAKTGRGGRGRDARETQGRDAPATDKRPVGVMPALKIADGVDQQLSASVKELDLPEKVIGQLIKESPNPKSPPTVGFIAGFIDAGTDLITALNLSNKDAIAVVTAVEKYRKKHRGAIAAKEMEAEKA